MPRSVSPAQSQAYEPMPLHIESVAKKRSKTTYEMVEDALVVLHNSKGVTLGQVHKYLLHTYNLELITKIRASLIKKYLKSLWISEDVVNVTGRGLVGHFKLVNKSKFEHQINKGATEKGKRRTAHPKSSQTKSLAHILPVIPRQVTPLPGSKSSCFDTPIVPRQGHASTPLISSFITRAPEARKNVHKHRKKKLSQDEIGTPRSSFPKTKRKLNNRPGN